jgi:ABC-type transport system involved in multi-copper enzyme maturation permease subunit
VVWTIVKKEFAEYTHSASFLIGLVIALGLASTSTFINARDFAQRQRDYTSAQEELKGNAFEAHVFRRPEVLSVLVQGSDRRLGNYLRMSVMDLPAKPTGYLDWESQHQRCSAGFAAIDFAFVVRIVLSLMVIFLVYDSVAGEKSRGTLRLMYANPVPRHALLLGKLVGGLAVVLLPLVIAMATAVLVIELTPTVALSGSDWLRIGWILGLSALYLAGLFTLGLFVSTIADRPSTALAILLQLWIVLTIVYPNLAVAAAETWYRLPSEREVLEQKRAAGASYYQEFTKTIDECNKHWTIGQQPPKELDIKMNDLEARSAEDCHRVDLEVGRKQAHQAHLAQLLSLLSPGALYDQAVVRVARTGIDEYETFMDAVERQWYRHVERWKLFKRDREAGRKMSPAVLDFLPEPGDRSFAGIVPQVSMLLLLTALSFMLAYTRFLRKDVR